MGNVETMKRGDVQMTSGGTGISHSEFNANKKYVIFSYVESMLTCKSSCPLLADLGSSTSTPAQASILHSVSPHSDLEAALTSDTTLMPTRPTSGLILSLLSVPRDSTSLMLEKGMDLLL